MPPLRIYLMIDFYLGPIAGTERQLHILASGLVERGHEVRLFVLRHTPFTQTGERFPCPIECLDVGSILSVDTLRKMRIFRERIRIEKPDIVHAYFNDCAILAPITCSTAKTRVFTSRRDMGFWYTPTLLFALSLANRRASRIICNSFAVATEVRRRERVRDEQLMVIHNAGPPRATFASDVWDADRTDSFIAKAELRDADNVRVCLVANLRPVKRIEDLLQAIALARPQFDRLTAWVIGAVNDSDYASKLQQLTRELALDSVVRFLPSTDRPLELMQQCDIGVLTSASEGLSNTLMEYMSRGLPVICSDVGGNPELVTHGEQGFLYPVADIDSLAGYLVKLGCNVELREAMGRRGLNRVADFSPQEMVETQIDAYRSTV